MTSPHPSASTPFAHGRPGSVSSLDAAGAYPPAGDRCRSCREILCSCPDAVFAGVAPAIDEGIDPEGREQGASIFDPLLAGRQRHRRVIDQSNHAAGDRL